jgi:hypothetical protein
MMPLWSIVVSLTHQGKGIAMKKIEILDLLKGKLAMPCISAYMRKNFHVNGLYLFVLISNVH